MELVRLGLELEEQLRAKERELEKRLKERTLQHEAQKERRLKEWLQNEFLEARYAWKHKMFPK